MKKILTIVLFALTTQSFAQTYPITGINIILPSSPDANTANWGTGSSVFNISATASTQQGRVNPAVEESKILVIIKKGGSKICGAYTSGSAPQANFSSAVKVWSGANATGLIGQDCKLPPGDYELSVQFFGYSLAKTVALSDEKIKPFTIRGNDQQAYQPPQPINPANGTAFKEEDIKKPITFRWTPVVPKTSEPVTYRLSVWQLMEGQTGIQAIKVNQPIFTKDLDNMTQAVVSNLITGPCKPPYMCSYIWNVQALTREGKPIGSNNGTSEAFAFKIVIVDPSTGCFKLDTTAYKIVCKGVDPHGIPIYSLTNLILTNTGTSPGRTGLHNTAATNYITPTAFTVTNLTPPSATNILPSSSVSFSFDINGATGSTATFVVNSTIINPSNSNLYCDKTIGVTVTLPSCTCTYCDQFKEWGFEQEHVVANTSAPFTVNLSTTISAPNVNIKSFKAELISFAQTGTEACFVCNKDSQTFGNFTGGTFGSWGHGVFPLDGVNTTHHTLTWFPANGTAAQLAGSNINLTFTVPPVNPLACCDDVISFCIRYSFTDKDCRTCSYVKCYSVTRKH